MAAKHNYDVTLTYTFTKTKCLFSKNKTEALRRARELGEAGLPDKRLELTKIQVQRLRDSKCIKCEGKGKYRHMSHGPWGELEDWGLQECTDCKGTGVIP